MRIRGIRLDAEGRSASRIAFAEGGRYLSIPRKRDILKTHQCPRNRVRYKGSNQLRAIGLGSAGIAVFVMLTCRA